MENFIFDRPVFNSYGILRFTDNLSVIRSTFGKIFRFFLCFETKRVESYSHFFNDHFRSFQVLSAHLRSPEVDYILGLIRNSR